MVMSEKKGELGRNAAIYGGALLLPRLAAFIALIVFSRLLSPAEYGYFALFMISVELIDTVLLNWIRIAFLRLFPEHERTGSLTLLRRCCLAMTGIAMVLSAPIAALLAYASIPDHWAIFFILLVSMVLANGIVRLRLAELQAQRHASRYFAIESVRAALSLVVGVAVIGMVGPNFAALSLGFTGANVGVAGYCLIPFARDFPRMVLDRAVLGAVVAYAGPIVPLTMLQSLIPLSERYVIQFVAGPAAVGVYAAVQNLVQQPISMLSSAVALAAFPIVMGSAELEGFGRARTRVREVGGYLLALGLPTVCGIIALKSEIASVVLGPAFREGAVAIVPWMAISALVLNLKYHYFDLAFHITRRTLLQLATLLPATLLTAPLIYIFLTIWGLQGAAAGACLAFTASCAASWLAGRRMLAIPHAFGEFARIVLAVGVMSALLWVIQPIGGGLPGLVLQISLGGIAYVLAALALNVLGIRTALLAYRGHTMHRPLRAS